MIKMGIIAEDESDIKTLKVFIRRVTDLRFKIRGHSTNGCGRLMNKCSNIAYYLMSKGVSHLIICQDLDTDDSKKLAYLKMELLQKVSIIPNHDNIVCIVIPIQEIEAWFLSDVSVLKKNFSGFKMSKINHPENIRSPKEVIQKASRTDNWKPRYVNTIHNEELAKDINIDKIWKKCPAFRPFYQFISEL